MDVLVIDIGGSSVKLFLSSTRDVKRFASGPELTPQAFMAGVREHIAGWRFDVVSVGFPGRIGPHGPTEEPGNLGNGWVGHDFQTAFGRPTLIVNDAILQALGGYAGGRMLFLGLGTGLGSALVANSIVVPLELGGLPYRGAMLWGRLGRAGRERYGHAAWMKVLDEATVRLRNAVCADYVLLGGGNADLVDPLPEGALRGGNEDAFTGGMRLWEDGVKHHDGSATRMWSVL
ncbi:hypothetical protein VVD49_17600 [Uliginosibacterium sp. H3]|uniref:ROK family protein n=1 Tax=Uliginosibacterium silvisoli TaxID=3114758 RepID=A0ABU6K7Y9_9RHOO|nr:hypothetical protein [Uliginosibacterium sp. H3]